MNIYENEKYKYYLLIPIILAIVSALMAPQLPRGIDLTGGASIIAPMNTDKTIGDIQNFLGTKGIKESSVRLTKNPVSEEKGVIIEFKDQEDIAKAKEIVDSDPAQAKQIASKYTNKTGEASQVVEAAENNFYSNLREDLTTVLGVNKEEISLKHVGAELSKLFWDTSIRALIVGFLFMAAIVFIKFRQIAPSSYVIGAAIFDILFTIGVMSTFGIHLTMPTIAALLLLIGYSVDTDIMLTSNVLERTGETSKKLLDAMKTGLTMAGTTLGVVSVITLVSYFAQINTIFQIGLVLFIGLIGDLIATWLMNAVILKAWVERK